MEQTISDLKTQNTKLIQEYDSVVEKSTSLSEKVENSLESYREMKKYADEIEMEMTIANEEIDDLNGTIDEYRKDEERNNINIEDLKEQLIICKETIDSLTFDLSSSSSNSSSSYDSLTSSSSSS